MPWNYQIWYIIIYYSFYGIHRWAQKFIPFSPLFGYHFTMCISQRLKILSKGVISIHPSLTTPPPLPPKTPNPPPHIPLHPYPLRGHLQSITFQDKSRNLMYKSQYCTACHCVTEIALKTIFYANVYCIVYVNNLSIKRIYITLFLSPITLNDTLVHISVHPQYVNSIHFNKRR